MRLDKLEAEVIYVLHRVVTECERPVMLYSIGKDLFVMLHLATKVFYPERPPFSFLYIDTSQEFHEMIELRDCRVKGLGINMLVYRNEETTIEGVNPSDYSIIYTDTIKAQMFKEALTKYRLTAVFGDGRRDGEKSRAKERIFSFCNEHHA